MQAFVNSKGGACASMNIMGLKRFRLSLEYIVGLFTLYTTHKSQQTNTNYTQ